MTVSSFIHFPNHLSNISPFFVAVYGELNIIYTVKALLLKKEMAIAIFRGRNYCMAVRGKSDSIWPILIKMSPGRFLFDYQSLLAKINN